MPLSVRHIPDLVALLLALAMQWRAVSHLAASPWANRSRGNRRIVQTIGWVGSAWLAFGLFFSAGYFSRFLSYSSEREWLRGMGIVYAMCLCGAVAVYEFWHQSPKFDPERRKVLHLARAATVAAPLAVCGYGVFLARNRTEFREVRIPVPGLHPDLDGLRLVQLTDIHFGPYLGRHELERAVAMANEAKAHVALVTGDLISLHQDPLDECLRLLSKLKADAGTYGCMGNHEIVAGCEDYAHAQGAKAGIRFLRQTSDVLRFGNGRLNLAGVDYQRMGRTYLKYVKDLPRPDATNILLSHNPDVFRKAARQGWDVTISGHTHGGQVNVEILGQNMNVARFFTPYVYGMYREGNSSIYVSRGLGTVGAPIRLGAPPEVNLIQLCAT